MMPIIFTILGVCIGIKLGKALKSGLLVGVGFVGLSIVTALLTTALGPALNSVVDIYDLQPQGFRYGWARGRQYSLQYFGRRADYPDLFGR